MRSGFFLPRSFLEISRLQRVFSPGLGRSAAGRGGAGGPAGPWLAAALATASQGYELGWLCLSQRPCLCAWRGARTHVLTYRRRCGRTRWARRWGGSSRIPSARARPTRSGSMAVVSGVSSPSMQARRSTRLLLGDGRRPPPPPPGGPALWLRTSWRCCAVRRWQPQLHATAAVPAALPPAWQRRPAARPRRRRVLRPASKVGVGAAAVVPAQWCATGCWRARTASASPSGR